MTEAVATTNHKVIRKWVESRDGHPAVVGEGVLRIDFGSPEDGFHEIDWDEFFEIFEDRKLAFLHQDMLDNGQVSRFNKLIERPN